MFGSNASLTRQRHALRGGGQPSVPRINASIDGVDPGERRRNDRLELGAVALQQCALEARFERLDALRYFRRRSRVWRCLSGCNLCYQSSGSAERQANNECGTQPQHTVVTISWLPDSNVAATSRRA